jgi:hypothetical protein
MNSDKFHKLILALLVVILVILLSDRLREGFVATSTAATGKSVTGASGTYTVTAKGANTATVSRSSGPGVVRAR